MKACRKCGAEKALEDFKPRKSSPDGRRNECRECSEAFAAEWRAANKPKIAAYNRKWAQKDPERTRALNKASVERQKANRSDFAERRRASYRKWLAANPEKAKAATAAWLAKNPGFRQRYAEENREHLRALYKAWAKANSGKVVAQARKHQLLKAQAMPKWLSPEQLALIDANYSMAATLTRLTGVKYQVDHIYPLNNPRVCGLHVPWNLRVITAKANRKKWAKLPEELEAA